MKTFFTFLLHWKLDRLLSQEKALTKKISYLSLHDNGWVTDLDMHIEWLCFQREKLRKKIGSLKSKLGHVETT